MAGVPLVHAAEQVVGSGVAALQEAGFQFVHPDGAAGLLLQPPGEAAVVGMGVGEGQRLHLVDPRAGFT